MFSILHTLAELTFIGAIFSSLGLRISAVCAKLATSKQPGLVGPTWPACFFCPVALAALSSFFVAFVSVTPLLSAMPLLGAMAQ